MTPDARPSASLSGTRSTRLKGGVVLLGVSLGWKDDGIDGEWTDHSRKNALAALICGAGAGQMGVLVGSRRGGVEVYSGICIRICWRFGGLGEVCDDVVALRFMVMGCVRVDACGDVVAGKVERIRGLEWRRR